MSASRPYCLSIAGFDPCAGAGVLSDIKVFEQLGVYGLGVSTAITFQNDKEFLGVNWLGFEEIEKQLMPLVGYPVRVVKIGLIQHYELLLKVLDYVHAVHKDSFIIWDPILNATAGFDFHADENLPEILFRKIDLVTPNKQENDQYAFTDHNVWSVLLKGGHSDLKKGTDLLYIAGEQKEIKGEEFDAGWQKHGTGCVLSSAIAAYIATGHSLFDACVKGKYYVEQFIKSNQSNLGYHT